jgi:hypothetical protein
MGVPSKGIAMPDNRISMGCIVYTDIADEVCKRLPTAEKN